MPRHRFAASAQVWSTRTRAGRSGGVGALLGEVLLEQDRLDEAREFITAARNHAAPRSIYYQAWWRRAMARVEARDGRHEQAVSLAREALALIEASDWLYFKAEAELALADVLRHGGSELEAGEAATRALALCEAKDHVSGAKRMRRFLEKSGGGVTASRPASIDVRRRAGVP